MFRCRQSFAVALLGSALVAGCGGSNGSAARAGTVARIDPCKVVSRAEAQTLMGVTFDAGEAKEQKVVGLSLCVYQESGKRGGGAMLQVGVTQQSAMPAGTKQTPESIFRSIRTDGFPDAPKLEGVGEDSFVAAPGVHILHHGVYLTVSVGLGPDRSRYLKPAAALAVANLERQMAVQ